MHPRSPSVSTTDLAPFLMMALAAASHCSSVLVGMPVSSAVSVSFGQMTSHNMYNSSGRGSLGAGAELKTVINPARRPARRAAIVVARGTSS